VRYFSSFSGRVGPPSYSHHFADLSLAPPPRAPQAAAPNFWSNPISFISSCGILWQHLLPRFSPHGGRNSLLSFRCLYDVSLVRFNGAQFDERDSIAFPTHVFFLLWANSSVTRSPYSEIDFSLGRKVFPPPPPPCSVGNLFFLPATTFPSDALFSPWEMMKNLPCTSPSHVLPPPPGGCRGCSSSWLPDPIPIFS